MDKDFLREAAKAIDAKLPDGYTFILLAAPVGESGRLVYASNMERECAICVLKEWLIKCSASEDWMRHLE